MFYSVEARSPFLDKEIYDYLEKFHLMFTLIYSVEKNTKNLINQKLAKNLISKSKKVLPYH